MFDSLLFYQVYIYRLCESPLCQGFKLLHYSSNKTHIFCCIYCVNMFTFLRAAGLPVEMSLIWSFSTGIRRIFWHDICKPVQCHTYAYSHVIPIPMFRYYLHVDRPTMLADLGEVGWSMVVTQACIIPFLMGVGLCDGIGEGALRRGHLDPPPPNLSIADWNHTPMPCLHCIPIDMVSCFNHSPFTVLVFYLFC